MEPSTSKGCDNNTECMLVGEQREFDAYTSMSGAEFGHFIRIAPLRSKLSARDMESGYRGLRSGIRRPLEEEEEGERLRQDYASRETWNPLGRVSLSKMNILPTAQRRVAMVMVL